MEQKLKVAIADFPPLIMSEDGRYKGFEIDLWEAVAKEIGADFEYQKYDFKQIVPLLDNKKVDIGLAGIAITEKREKIIDFSHETLDSGLLISVNKDRNKPKFFETIKTVFHEGGKIIAPEALGVLAFIFIAGNVLWLVEKSAGTFNKNYVPGVFESFWLTIVSMTTVGFGDFFPHTWLGRIVTAVIIFSGTIIFGLLVAQVTAFLAVRKVKGEINGSRDLAGKSVAVIEGSVGENTMRKMGAKIVRTINTDEAFEQLKNGSVDAVVVGAPAAIWHEKNDQEKQLEIIGEIFDKQKYGIAMIQGSDLRENINRAILKIIESGQYDEFYHKWFGDDLMMEV